MSLADIAKATERLLQEVDAHAGHDHDDHDDHAEEESIGGMSVTGFKILLLFIMILCVGFGLVPKLWGGCRNSENTLSLLNCFSAGIFLAMSLVHMMPESAEIYGMWAKKEGIDRAFPLPYVCFFLGYLLILGIDRVAAKAYHAGHDHGHSKEDKTITADKFNNNKSVNGD